MDAGTADTINRRTAREIADHLDLTDWLLGVKPGDPYTGTQWHLSGMADAFLVADTATTSDCAWLLGALAVRASAIDWDGVPADCDWDNLFAHFREEISARRDPKAPQDEAAETCLANVV